MLMVNGAKMTLGLIPEAQDITRFLFLKWLFQNIIIDSGDKQENQQRRAGLDEYQFPAL